MEKGKGRQRSVDATRDHDVCRRFCSRIPLILVTSSSLDGKSCAKCWIMLMMCMMVLTFYTQKHRLPPSDPSYHLRLPAYPSTFHRAVRLRLGLCVTCTVPSSSPTASTTLSSICEADATFLRWAIAFLVKLNRFCVGVIGNAGFSTHCLKRSKGI